MAALLNELVSYKFGDLFSILVYYGYHLRIRWKLRSNSNVQTQATKDGNSQHSPRWLVP